MTERPAELVRSLLVFTTALIAGQALLLALKALLGLGGGGTLASVGLVVAAALVAGRDAARRTGRAPRNRERLLFAVVAGLIALVIGIVLLWGVFRLAGMPFTITNLAIEAGFYQHQADDFLRLLPVILGITAAMNIALCYLGHLIGARMGARGAETEG